MQLDTFRQEPALDDEGRPLLVCENRHLWSDERLERGGSRSPFDRVAAVLESLTTEDELPARARTVLRWAVEELRGIGEPNDEWRTRTEGGRLS